MSGATHMKLFFLIAGVQKAATGALHHYLRQHPELYLPETKELHFFDKDDIDWTAPPYDTVLHSHFANAPPGSLWGEATPVYAYWPLTPCRIHAYNPDMRIIIILRDPVGRAYSHWRMNVERSYETLDFSRAIRERRAKLFSDVEADRSPRYGYIERGFYAEQINRLLHYFQRNRIHFLTMYDLLNHRVTALDRICEFLGISRFSEHPDHNVVFSHANKDLPHPSRTDVAYLRSLFRDDLEQTQTIIGREIEAEWT